MQKQSGYIFCAGVVWMLYGWVGQALARPVSYPGGVTLSFTYGADKYSGLVHYSPSARWSIGYLQEYWDMSPAWHLYATQVNYLAKRWNNLASQANVYLQTGAGWTRFVQGDDAQSTHHHAAGWIGLMTDWEDEAIFYRIYKSLHDVL